MVPATKGFLGWIINKCRLPPREEEYNSRSSKSDDRVRRLRSFFSLIVGDKYDPKPLEATISMLEDRTTEASEEDDLPFDDETQLNDSNNPLDRICRRGYLAKLARNSEFFLSKFQGRARIEIHTIQLENLRNHVHGILLF